MTKSHRMRFLFFARWAFTNAAEPTGTLPEDFISVSISDRPIWDAPPRSIPFNSAELVGNDACRHPRLELEANLGEIRRKVLARLEDILFGTDDVVVIDDSY